MYLHESYNIEALNFLLDSININIPQLKAFNLMKFTRKITTEELNEMIIENEVANVAALIDDYHRWNDPRLQPTLSYEMKPSKRRRYLKYDEETGWDESDGKIFMEDIEKQQNLNARRTEKTLSKM